MSQINLELRLEGAEPGGSVANMAVLGDVMRQWSDVIDAVRRAQTIDVGADQIFIKKVSRGSLRMRSSLPRELARSVALVSEAIRSDQLRLLPRDAREPMKRCASTLRRSRQALRIVRNKSAGIIEAVMRDCPSDVDAAPVRGVTSIHGRLRSVGGASPVLKIETGSGVVTVVLAEEQAQRIAPLIYSMVELDVKAEWSTEDGVMESCTLLDWRKGPAKTLIEGIHELALHHGEAWRDVDVAKWIRDMRGDR